MYIDLHTHSIASGHGTRDTITDMAKEAKKRGLTLLGFSEHSPAMMGAASHSYFKSYPRIPRMRCGLPILLGAEVNILSPGGSLDLDDETLSTLDYAIASLHTPIFHPVNAAIHTAAYINAMKHPSVCIIGHPDDAKFPIYTEELVLAAKASHVLLEINNASLSPAGYRGDAVSCDLELLTNCKKYAVPVIIGSDSHGKSAIGDDRFARSLMEQVNFPSELIANDHPHLLASYLPLKAPKRTSD